MEHLLKIKCVIFKGECALFSFNKCPNYTHDGASAKCSTNSRKTDNSVCSRSAEKEFTSEALKVLHTSEALKVLHTPEAQKIVNQIFIKNHSTVLNPESRFRLHVKSEKKIPQRYGRIKDLV
jgi:hypothetical protein